MKISFPFEMHGALRIFAGLLDSAKHLKPFEEPWEGLPSESIKFKTQFESPGQHYIHFTFEHSGLKESDTLTVDKVQQTKSVFVRDLGPQS